MEEPAVTRKRWHEPILDKAPEGWRREKLSPKGYLRYYNNKSPFSPESKTCLVVDQAWHKSVQEYDEQQQAEKAAAHLPPRVTTATTPQPQELEPQASTQQKQYTYPPDYP